MLSQIGACDELFHTATGTAFADLLVDGHRETWPIRSKRFRGWLRRRYYQATGDALGAPAISSGLDLLEARAQFDAPERSVHVRVAEQAGNIFLDLADDHWRAIEIGPDGWRVNQSPPVRFRRPAGMWPLPVPQHGGSIESLMPFLNLSSRNDFVLVVAWLLATLLPGGPYPLLAISGEQGSAKTVLSKILKALVDPNAAPVRALPREERELMIAANNGYLLAFDNLSVLPAWLSDAPCRLASGGSAKSAIRGNRSSPILGNARNPCTTKSRRAPRIPGRASSNSRQSSRSDCRRAAAMGGALGSGLRNGPLAFGHLRPRL
jgi:hypothetical protein